MPNPKIQDKFLKLPTPYKIVGIGALIALIGAFLPWYQDIDAFNTGDKFSGISGPLYLIGYIIIGLSIISLIFTGFHLFERKIPSLPLKESMIYILSGAFSLFLLVVTNSVYFHPKFGINITSKEYQFGMIFAFAGALATVIGGVLDSKERGTARFIEEFQSEAQEDEDIDDVIELNNFQKEQQREKNITERVKPSAGVREYKTKSDWAPAAEPRRVEPRQEQRPEPVRAPSQPTKVWRAEPDRAPSSQPTKVRQEPFPDVSILRKEREPGRIMSAAPSSSASNKEKEEINPNTVIRMDL
jgi:hypothetical protein